MAKTRVNPTDQLAQYHSNEWERQLSWHGKQTLDDKAVAEAAGSGVELEEAWKCRCDVELRAEPGDLGSLPARDTLASAIRRWPMRFSGGSLKVNWAGPSVIRMSPFVTPLL